MKKLLLATLFISLCTPVKPFNWQPIAQAARSCTEWAHSNPGKFVAGATALAALGYIGYRGYTYYMTSPSKDKNTTNFSVTPANTEEGHPIGETTTNETQDNMLKILMSMFQNFSSNYSPQEISTTEIIFSDEKECIHQIKALNQYTINNLKDSCALHAIINGIGMAKLLKKSTVPLIRAIEDSLPSNNDPTHQLFDQKYFEEQLDPRKNLGEIVLKARQTQVLKEWLDNLLEQQLCNKDSIASVPFDTVNKIINSNIKNITYAIAHTCIHDQKSITSALTTNEIVAQIATNEVIKNNILTYLCKGRSLQDKQDIKKAFDTFFTHNNLALKFPTLNEALQKALNHSFEHLLQKLIHTKYSTKNSQYIENLQGNEVDSLLDSLLASEKSIREMITVVDDIEQLKQLEEIALITGKIDNFTKFKYLWQKKFEHGQNNQNASHVFITGTMETQNASTSGHWIELAAQIINGKKEVVVMDSINKDRTKHKIVTGLVKFLNTPLPEEIIKKLFSSQKSKTGIED